mmetsp:Transcript_13227/g.32085  ORF Transcript_13227/g.32085 Transcript_13227/m.32085 type:complete len:254 (+) Transcript_13227:388-1149(+)
MAVADVADIATSTAVLQLLFPPLPTPQHAALIFVVLSAAATSTPLGTHRSRGSPPTAVRPVLTDLIRALTPLDLPTRAGVLAPGPIALFAHHVLPDVAQLLDAHRLQKVINRPVDDSTQHHVGRTVGGHHHHRDVEFERDVLQELEPVHVRHVHVAQHDVKVFTSVAQRRQRFRAPREGGDDVLAAMEHLLHDSQAQRVVVHNKDTQARGKHRGRGCGVLLHVFGPSRDRGRCSLPVTFPGTYDAGIGFIRRP